MRVRCCLLLVAAVALSCGAKKPAPDIAVAPDDSPPPAEVPADTSASPEEVASLEFPVPIPEVPYAEPIGVLQFDTIVVTGSAISFATLGIQQLGSRSLDPDTFETLVELEEGRVPAAQKKGGEASLYITPLVDRLESRSQASSRDWRLTLLVDPDTDYRLLTEILYSAGQRMISGFDFVVRSDDALGVIRVDAPELPNCAEDPPPACTTVTAVVKDGTSLFMAEQPRMCPGEAEVAFEPVRFDSGQCVYTALEPDVVGQLGKYPEPQCSSAIVVADPDSPASEVLAVAAALHLSPATTSTALSLPAGEVSHNCDWPAWTPENDSVQSSGDFRYEDHARKSAEVICDWYDSCADEELVFALTAALQRESKRSSLAWNEVFEDAVRRGEGKLSHRACMTMMHDKDALASRRLQAKIDAGFVKFSPRNGVACREAASKALPACEERKLAFDALDGLMDPALRGKREEVSLRMRARLNDGIARPVVCDAVLEGTVPDGDACDVTAECLDDAMCVDGTCQQG